MEQRPTESKRAVNSARGDTTDVVEERYESDENNEEEGEEDDMYELTESKDNTLVDMCVKVLGRHLGDVEWSVSAPLPAELTMRIHSIHKNAQLANEIKSASLAKRATKDETHQNTTPTPSVW